MRKKKTTKARAKEVAVQLQGKYTPTPMDKTFAAQVIHRAYGVSMYEAVEFLNLAGRPALGHLTTSLKDLLMVPNDMAAAKETLEGAIASFNAFHSTLKEEEIMQSILQNPLSREEITEKLAEIGSEVSEENQVLANARIISLDDPRYLQGYGLLELVCIDKPMEIGDLSAMRRLQHVRKLADHVAFVYESADKRATKRYITDLIHEVVNAGRIIFKSEQVVPFTFATPFVEQGACAIDLLDRQYSFHSSYVALSGSSLEFLTLCKGDPPTAPEDVEAVAKRVIDLDPSIGASMGLRRLLRSVNVEERVDLLEHAGQYPEQIQYHKEVKKQGVSERKYAEFLLTRANHRVGERSVFEEFRDLSTSASSNAAVAELISSHYPIEFDENYERVKSVTSHSSGQLIIADYLKYKLQDEDSRAEITLRIGELDYTPAELKPIRAAIASASGAELDSLAEQQFNRSTVAAFIKAPKKEVSVAKKKDKTSWYDSLVRDPQFEGIKDHLDLAYRILDGSAHRLRSVARAGANAMADFCSDVVAYSDSRAFNLILGNDHLFSRYQELLGTSAREKFLVFISDIRSHSNPYAEVSRYLHAKDAHPIIPFPQTHMTLDNENIPTKPTRIFIWGGQHKGQALDRIKAAAGETPIEVYGLANTRNDMGHMREGDLAIWLTGSNHHSGYGPIKAAADNQKFQLYRFNETGFSRLVPLIERIVANG